MPAPFFKFFPNFSSINPKIFINSSETPSSVPVALLLLHLLPRIRNGVDFVLHFPSKIPKISFSTIPKDQKIFIAYHMQRLRLLATTARHEGGRIMKINLINNERRNHEVWANSPPHARKLILSPNPHFKVFFCWNSR
jgi:hypothetical protein